jgi:hypothetical protein
MATSAIGIERFKKFLETDLQSSPIKERIEELKQKGISAGGKEREGIFRKEFFCESVRRFFYEEVRQELDLSQEKIKKGLGTEGWKKCPGFGFTPARQRKHLFTKSQVIKPFAPKSWRNANRETLTGCQACPDFAIRKPLPFTVVGEIKYFVVDSAESAVRELYDAARQAVFYLGAFPNEYESALIVVADASKNHSFFKGLELIKPELLKRFGVETDIHLVTIQLH